MNSMKRLNGVTMTIQVTDGPSDERDRVEGSTQPCEKRDDIADRTAVTGLTGTLSLSLGCWLKAVLIVGSKKVYHEFISSKSGKYFDNAG